MEDQQIEVLKTKVSVGSIYWRNADGVCFNVVKIIMNWVEFPDEPDLIEPAAILSNGNVVALYNADAIDFDMLAPISYI